MTDEQAARVALSLLAALDAKPAKRVCPECGGKRFELGFGPVGVELVRIGVCQTCHGAGKVDPPTDAQLLRTAALWMMHLSESYLPEGGDAAAQTTQMCDDLRRLAARLEQDPPPPDVEPEPVSERRWTNMDLTESCMDFGEALKALKAGWKVRRMGWNGKGIHLELQVPDERSKMTAPYIFIDTTGLQTDNPAAPKARVPWLASQTDMLADDWETVA